MQNKRPNKSISPRSIFPTSVSAKHNLQAFQYMASGFKLKQADRVKACTQLADTSRKHSRCLASKLSTGCVCRENVFEIGGSLELCLGGLSHKSPPWRRGTGIEAEKQCSAFETGNVYLRTNATSNALY